ncbi:MAG: Gfo/Idh/MocA family oxidoreductase [Oscillospiraceae bacterium]|jgi:predicted dehydrogenase|nr:Gfo/Idh/MocA family oxidoreductase [Oscillospiraceae bacterium]
MAKLKVGIIGCGGIATQKHLPSMQQTELADAVAFCDIVLEKAESAAKTFGEPNSKVFKDYRDLLKLDLDAVYVCTPNRSHSEIAVAALESKKHVMCEKPMAINYAEALKMAEAAKRNGKLLTIGYQNRYRSDTQFLKKECAAGVLGEIYYAKARSIRRRAVPTWGVFLNEYEQGGGPLIDVGTHSLDLALWMMDNYTPKSVTGVAFHKLNDQTEPANAWGAWDPKQFTVEDSAFGFIIMENGAAIQLETSWALNSLEIGEPLTLLCGTKGGADMFDGLRINGVKHDRQYEFRPDFGAKGVDFYDGDTASPQFREQLAFLGAVRGENELVVLPEQAMAVTRILDAVYESARIGKQVVF